LACPQDAAVPDAQASLSLGATFAAPLIEHHTGISDMRLCLAILDHLLMTRWILHVLFRA
jgi:hypothetical protein